MANNRLHNQREFALSVVQQLRDAGYEALWAGGCVRDRLLGLEPKDYDVATDAQPEQVRDLFGRRRTLAIGAAFGVIAVRCGALRPIDVATFRSDGLYKDGRRPESVQYTSAEFDAQRRDFTINGLFYDPLAERVIDYVDGLSDLRSRVVRAIGEPHQRFAEDKLRMLRAIRFAATYDFAIEPATLRAIADMAPEVIQVSGERIGQELRRVVSHANRSAGIRLLAESGLIRTLLPELATHAVADDQLWQAALARLQALRVETAPAGLAGLFFGMLDAGAVAAVGRRWRLTNKEMQRIAWLLENLPSMLRAEHLPWPRLQRLLAQAGAEELLALAESVLPSAHPAMIRCREQLARPASEWNPPPLVTGDDLTSHGLAAGKYFAALLEHLRDEQLLGRLHTKNEALAAADEWVARHARDQER